MAKVQKDAPELHESLWAAGDIIGVNALWRLSVIQELAAVEEAGHERGVHFKELQRKLRGISPKVLSKVLKDLVDGGVVATVQKGSGHAPYVLTAKGAALVLPLVMLKRWGDEYGDRK